MEEVLEILRGLHPEVDYETCETLYRNIDIRSQR